MANTISTDCIACGACAPECPNQAISQGEETYRIDQERCTECVGFYAVEACQAVCPSTSCVSDPNCREDEAVLVERALRLHPDDRVLRARIESRQFPSRFRMR